MTTISRKGPKAQRPGRRSRLLSLRPLRLCAFARDALRAAEQASVAGDALPRIDSCCDPQKTGWLRSRGDSNLKDLVALFLGKSWLRFFSQLFDSTMLSGFDPFSRGTPSSFGACQISCYLRPPVPCVPSSMGHRVHFQLDFRTSA